MIVVIFEVTGQPPQLDGYPDDVKIFNKEGFIKINSAQNELLALYHPNRVVAIRKVAVPPNAQTVHPGDGAKGLEPGPDR